MIRVCTVLLMRAGALSGNIPSTLTATSVAVAMVGRLIVTSAVLIRAISGGKASV